MEQPVWTGHVLHPGNTILKQYTSLPSWSSHSSEEGWGQMNNHAHKCNTDAMNELWRRGTCYCECLREWSIRHKMEGLPDGVALKLRFKGWLERALIRTSDNCDHTVQPLQGLGRSDRSEACFFFIEIPLALILLCLFNFALLSYFSGTFLKLEIRQDGGLYIPGIWAYAWK